MPIWIKLLSAVCLIALQSTPSLSHEFWIEGEAAQTETGHALSLDFKVGQRLAGQSLPYIPSQVVTFRRLDMPGMDLGGRIGALPADEVGFDPHEGFAAFVEMAPRTLRHNDWQKFLTYLRMEGLNDIQAAHKQRGLPQVGFTESYARHAKLLVLPQEIARALPAHASQAVIDIVILDIRPEGEAQMSVFGQVLIGTVPAAHKAISVFDQRGGDTKISTLLTDDEGRFTLVTPYTGKVLLNTILMSDGVAIGTDWHSDWASLLILK